MESNLPPSPSEDDVLDELAFAQVMLASLDPGADDYAERAEELQGNRRALETRLASLQNMEQRQKLPSLPQSRLAKDNGDQLAAYSYPDVGTASSAGRVHSHKRVFPRDIEADSGARLSKRPTPDPSTASTPSSSNESLDSMKWESTEPTNRATSRQAAAVAAAKRNRDIQKADEQFARSLSQASGQPQLLASPFPSSSRSSVQTTLGHSGSIHRPSLQVKSESSFHESARRPKFPPPAVKVFTRHPTAVNPLLSQGPQYEMAQPGSSRQQKLAQRPRETALIDLTGSDGESDGERDSMSETTLNNTSVHRSGRAPFSDAAMPHSQRRPMPGAFPSLGINGAQSVKEEDAENGLAHQRFDLVNQSSLTTAMGGIRNAAFNIASQFSDLNRLINGSRSRPHPADDDSDDELIFSHSRSRNPDLNLYSGHEDLFRSRYDAMANYDPTKTREEINALLENIRPDEDMPEHLRVQTPQAMTIKLHKYQELGLTWLKNCEEGSNAGGILADDMGLGKTIQMLSLIVTRPSQDIRCKTTLVVAPVALLRQWRQEIEQKIKPGYHALTVFIHHAQSKKSKFSDLKHYDVVLTTYGSIASEVKRLDNFRRRQRNDPDARPGPSETCVLIGEDAQWYRVILDEAQCIKNRSTQTAKAAYLLNARYRFCMTGTPMMNSVDELFSLIQFLRIRPYASWEKFRIDFSTPLKSGQEHIRAKAMHMFQTVCKAIMLRRTKTSTFEGKPILVLPERTTEIDNPTFSEDELTFYQSLEQRTQLQFNKYLRNGTVGQSYSAILVLLLRLRQACCHPHLIKDFGVSAAADVTSNEMMELAKQLSEQVIARIKDKQGAFDCPVCYDASTNPAIFIPCGHDTCSDCFAKITDPSNAIAAGNGEGGTQAKCPNCRGVIDSKRVTDFDSFKKVHQLDLLTEQERTELDGAASDTESDDSIIDSSGGEEDGAEDETKDPTLGGFIVDDHAADDSEHDVKVENANAVKYECEANGNGSSRLSKSQSKINGKTAMFSKSKPDKGKQKKRKKTKTVLTIAELKKLSGRNATMRKAYLQKLRKDYISSAKIDKTMEILDNVMDRPESEKVLIFSQWTSLLDFLEVPIDRKGWGYRRYDGSMNARMRGDAVDDFRDDKKDVRIMLISLKAGNAGLNLNMASQVIILDPFWNPYIEEQAIDRAHRIGQTRPVQVHRVLVAGTVEDRIIQLQEKKRALISEALDEKASQNIARLGVQELAYLFGVTTNPRDAVQYIPQNGRRR